MTRHPRKPYRQDLLRELDEAGLKKGRKSGSYRTRSKTDEGTIPGRVLANFGIQCLVRFDNGDQARLPISRHLGAVAGDLVYTDDKRVLDILPRQSVLARADAQRTQILAANIDRIVLVQSASDPPYKPGLTDRYQVFAAVTGLPLILLLNKIDEQKPGVLDAVPRLRALGVEVMGVSAKSGDGIDALIAALQEGISVFSGHSGVGKSSLLNRLMPGSHIPVGDQHPRWGRGRHKTAVARAYPFGKGFLVDTPGIRRFGFVGVAPQQVSRGFPDIDEIKADCRFRNCLHLKEPDCAVIQAVKDNRLSSGRYNSYLRILRSLA